MARPPPASKGEKITTQNESLLGYEIDAPASREPSLILVKYTVAVVLIGAVVTEMALGVVIPNASASLLAPLLLLVVALAGWYLLARGRVGAAIRVLVLGVWSVMTGVAVVTGGVHAPVVIVYPLIILMAGWLISSRVALALAGTTVALTLGLVLAEARGFLPKPLVPPHSIYAADQIIVYVLSAVLVVFVVRAYQNRLQELRRASNDLVQLTFDLETSETELHQAQAVAKVGSWVYDIPADTLQLSDETCRIFGLPHRTLGSHASYLAHVHPDDRALVDRTWQAALQGGAFDHEHRAMVGSSIRWIRQKAELEFAPDGRPLRAVGITQDITERKLAEAALQESEERYRTLIEWSPEPILVHRMGTILYVNPAAIKLFGARDAQALVGKSTEQLIHPDFVEAQRARMKSINAHEAIVPMVEARFLQLDGTAIDVEVQGTAIVYDGEPAIQVCIRDISERKLMEDQIRQLVFHDALTRLPNRRLLNERLSQTMAASRRSARYAALMFLDLDNFKPLNDTHGHDVGDLLLIEVADRLKHCVREVDTVARFGGDEFVVMLNELDCDKAESTLQTAKVAEKIRISLAEPYVLTIKTEGLPDALVEHHCSASIGVVVFVNHEGGQDEILKWADTAMYQAKVAGRNLIRFYAGPMCALPAARSPGIAPSQTPGSSC